jgi:mannan endo-1,4-beta-mannosidase
MDLINTIMKRVFSLMLIIAVLLSCVKVSGQKKTKFKTLDYLYSISGYKTVAGIHNREPNATPARWTNMVDSVTGRTPGLWSGDFLFQKDNINNRQVMVDEALRQWKNGAIVNIMWHACNPALLEPCGWNSEGVKSKLTDEQWKELTTDGSPLNIIWKQRVDAVCFYLQFLEDNGVEVLWRPMHEMNQGAFWWGGRPGPDGTAKLYKMLHEYMTNEKKLTNLIWVWDIQDFQTLGNDALVYNPGDQYWDVAALDIYDDKSGYSEEKYKIMGSVSNGKPIAIGECQKLPTAEQLILQKKWIFFMGWSELEFSKNSIEQIKTLHNAPNIVTLDKMPGWN